MRLTRHNGRAGKFGTYNPKHNDRQFNVEHSEHIDPTRTKFNIYFDCYTGYRGNGFPDRDPESIISFEEIERMYYTENYGDFLEGQNHRNEAHGHANRNRTVEDLLANKTTCPEETVYQIGTIEAHVSEEVLFNIVTDFLAEFTRRFGSHVHILDFALHCDEGTPHIQERHVFDALNQYGELCPQQEKALEELGFELPHPDKPKSKYNRRKNVFDAACREMLFDITERYGLHLDREPSYGGRAYLEKQDYILMKQKEKLLAQDKQIEQKESELEELSIRIDDVETLIDEVAEMAYDKAVETVTDRVQEETHNADFELIRDYEKEIMRSSSLTDKGMAFAHQILSGLEKKFRARKAAEAYGIRVNRNGMACCPFHDDHTPSLKLDQRYHCFGCGADGDVIDFTAQLFGIGKKDAAVKLASDFGISYDDGRTFEMDGKSNAKGRKKKVRRFSPEYRFAETERRFFRILTDYYHLLCRWREEDAPKTPEEEWGRRFTDSLRDMTLVEYLMDTMLTGTLEEKIDLMNGYREKVKEYERILEEDSGRKTGSAGGDDGGLWAGRAA